jgi:D-glycero-alpha-D-manno-heptose-7-phosphate kinase
MRIEIRQALLDAKDRGVLPAIEAYNRIDGPGSSLDLHEFQESMWIMPPELGSMDKDPAIQWSFALPRTVGVTINVGTKIRAEPFERGLIGVRSADYNTEVVSRPGEVFPSKKNWLLKIVEAFGLTGVMFTLRNLRAGIQSSGLGGSATATTGLAILANELAGRPFQMTQLVTIASRIEENFGVSITGMQEQSNVAYGGITDYVWFPWGIPGEKDNTFATSVRQELLPPSAYGEFESRSAIFHSGKLRDSTDVNQVWMNALYTAEGYGMHRKKLRIAYDYREALRLREWKCAMNAIEDYCKIREVLCPAYFDGAEAMREHAKASECVAFPLGAGGGGGIFVFSAEPSCIQALRRKVGSSFREVPFKVLQKGHKLENLSHEVGRA